MARVLDTLRDLAGRAPDLWRGFFDAFVRDNRVLPPVVALLALFLFAWVVAGAFVDEQDGDDAEQANLVQSGSQEDGTPISPESEDRDADSFAAYRNKDPFRQLLAPAPTPEETSDDAAGDDAFEETTTEETTATPETTTGGGGENNNGGNGGQRSRADSDGDGVTNRKEERLGLDPRNRDTDGDGVEDGDDDSDGDGVPDGQRGGGGGGNGGSGNGSGNRGNGNDDDLLDSGGARGRR